MNNCEQELIHIPSAIQPHGFLLEVNADQQVIHCSDNVSEFIGYEPKELFANGIQEIAPDLLAKIQHSPNLIYEPSGILLSFPIQFNHKNGESIFYDGIISKSKNGYIIECEVIDRNQSAENISNNLLLSIMNVHREEDLSSFLSNVSDQMRKLSGYDRIMVYQFDENWNGEVISESKREDLLPFLGLHYPASDIPVQARTLYLTNLMRLIVDVNYKPSTLLKPSTRSNDGILDQSYSILRSVSPIHLEYLQNMGVKATLVLSIIIDGKLWGLIACHQYSSAKHLSISFRNSILLLTQFTSLKIESFQNLKRDKSALAFANIRNLLLEQMAAAPEFLNGLINGKVTLLDFIESTGVAVKLGGQMLTLGDVPDTDTIEKIIKTFAKQLDPNRVFASESIASIDPAWEYLKDTVSGLLMVQIKSSENLSILWFRKERLHTIKWSGDPHKAMTADGNNIEKLHPRKSFEAWSEEVKLTSLPWQEVELQAAVNLKNSIKITILHKFNEITNLFSEIDLIRFREEKANTSLNEKEILLKEIHHRVKNNMQVIIAMLDMQSDFSPYPDVKLALIASQNRIKAMSILHEILYANDTSTYIAMKSYFTDLVAYSAASNSQPRMPEILLDVQDICFAIDTAIPCGLILNEAVTNCFKYAFPDSSKQMNPKIYVSLIQVKDKVEYCISDNGNGFPETMNIVNPKSLGVTLINALIKQIDGNLNFTKSEEGGAKIKIDFSAKRIHTFA